MRLETDRLIIKPLSIGNLDSYAAILADPEVQRYLNDGVPRTRDYACAYIEDLVEIMNVRGFTRYGVFDRTSVELLGHCGFKDIDGRIDHGWTLVRSAWGKGIGTEAARAVAEYGFDTLNFDLITARTTLPNKGSIGVMKAIGMTFSHAVFWQRPEDQDGPGEEGVEYHLRRESLVTSQP